MRKYRVSVLWGKREVNYVMTAPNEDAVVNRVIRRFGFMPGKIAFCVATEVV